MDTPTLHACAAHAHEIAERHRQTGSSGVGVSRYFAQAFESDDRILDVGAGSGRDMAMLVSSGHVAYGIEPVGENTTPSSPFGSS